MSCPSNVTQFIKCLVVSGVWTDSSGQGGRQVSCPMVKVGQRTLKSGFWEIKFSFSLGFYDLPIFQEFTCVI